MRAQACFPGSIPVIVFCSEPMVVFIPVRVYSLKHPPKKGKLCHWKRRRKATPFTSLALCALSICVLSCVGFPEFLWFHLMDITIRQPFLAFPFSDRCKWQSKQFPDCQFFFICIGWNACYNLVLADV